MHSPIYADFNATTPLSPDAMAQMQLAFTLWGNPSSAHRVGRKANELLEDSRKAIALAVGAEPSEVVFTSGGSEANTLALLGSLYLQPGLKLLTSKVEHSSIRDTLLLMAKQGAEITYVPVTRDGAMDIEAFERQLDEFKPHLVSLMSANNETGVIFPIPKIGKLCRAREICLHTDAVQAFGKMPFTHWARANLVSVSAHKVHGPKGVGALIIRRGSKLIPTHYGGSQEIKRRGGTENMVGIAGFGGACSRLSPIPEVASLASLRDRFESELLEKLDRVTIQGRGMARLPNTSNIRFMGIPSEVILSTLDMDGVSVSAGSACSSGSISPSHVLLEMGLLPEEAKECVRFSWGTETTGDDIDTVLTLVINHVTRIRSRKKRGAQASAPENATEKWMGLGESFTDLDRSHKP